LSAPLIIGGGPAGAAAAIVLAQAGCRATLIERNPGRADKVCGDFLSGEAVASLRALGVTMPDAVSIGALRLVKGNRQATTRLPFERSLPRCAAMWSWC
jgi:flavin-dependent dehydrogenase